MLTGKRILLIISGGIAAYKSLELIRLIRKNDGQVRCILTKGGAEFITPLSVSSLTGEATYTDLFSLKDETEMGHIRLSREADLLVVAPASANMIAKMAHGLADDLAAACLLATDKPVMICPAMNPMMWENAATRDNISTLKSRGVLQVGPAAGDMACGEVGAGRLSEPEDILAAITAHFQADKPLAGYSAVVTSGPTHEPIDPVRFIANRSSGKQGHAIASALSDAGASVTLVTGPVSLPDPRGVKTVKVETAVQMLDACRAALPADILVCAAAVGDWTPESVAQTKLKKAERAPTLPLKENPDILAVLSAPGKNRPRLCVGFAAETGDLLANGRAKLKKKNCDMLVANDVSEGVFGADENHVFLITARETEEWPRAEKKEIARNLAAKIAAHLKPFLKEAAE